MTYAHTTRRAAVAIERRRNATFRALFAHAIAGVLEALPEHDEAAMVEAVKGRLGEAVMWRFVNHPAVDAAQSREDVAVILRDCLKDKTPLKVVR